mmetsp:Transcript_862/g.1793  ORF Transcript_862/g.1793 Transcript_862/m.1793 type:complete len:222 (-) Transcript_862:1092-1757(-)
MALSTSTWPRRGLSGAVEAVAITDAATMVVELIVSLARSTGLAVELLLTQAVQAELAAEVLVNSRVTVVSATVVVLDSNQLPTVRSKALEPQVLLLLPQTGVTSMAMMMKMKTPPQRPPRPTTPLALISSPPSPQLLLRKRLVLNLMRLGTPLPQRHLLLLLHLCSTHSTNLPLLPRLTPRPSTLSATILSPQRVTHSQLPRQPPPLLRRVLLPLQLPRRT